MLYGYYSEKQAQQNKIIHVYLKNNKEVYTSEVCNIKKTDLTENFDDNVFVGIVDKFVRNIHTTGFVRKLK